ncbi:hypothetical protein Catovirus_1_213 [Catovirus CTV1]|uniref:Uncharacterized protein n=1 Tax=Catovirus CTV1 TaxID=1977631 RepID=A0A1V0S8Y3_9VIRU|nr:hypothetical protein Catovirus_1_213 [Catovirus CTV1]
MKNNEYISYVVGKRLPENTFVIHDNFNKPFYVIVKGNNVHIYKQEKTIYAQESKNVEYLYSEYLIISNCKNVLLGKDSSRKSHIGNTILLEISRNKYMYINYQIYSFETDEKITDLYSPIGNNDVPYAYAVSKNYIYLLSDQFKYLPIESIGALYALYLFCVLNM